MNSQLQVLTRKDFDSNISIAPSDRVYFNEYPYRVDLEAPQHPHPLHDPAAHWYVSDLMRTSNMFWKRERRSAFKRSIYLGDIEDVKWLCNWASEQVTRVVGPVSKKHINMLKNNDHIFNHNGCISESIENQLDWKYIESTPKDLLIFDSYIPHKSDKNNSSNSRSIFYFTFNKLSEGNHYQKYVENKRKYFPPENERNNQNIDLNNNKYNLGNPLK